MNEMFYWLINKTCQTYETKSTVHHNNTTMYYVLYMCNELKNMYQRNLFLMPPVSHFDK